jgi:hypothetical protein
MESKFSLKNVLLNEIFYSVNISRPGKLTLFEALWKSCGLCNHSIFFWYTVIEYQLIIVKFIVSVTQ